MMGGHAVWAGVGDATHALGAFACVIALGWLWQRRGPLPAVQRASALSLAATALWCLAVAAEGSQSLAAGLVQALRNLAYLGTVYALFAGDGRHTSVAQVRPVMAALAMVAVMQPLVLLAQYRLAGELGPAAYQANTLMALLQVVGSLVLLHNLYAGGSNAARQLLRWPVLGLAAVWVFELNLYTAAYLGDGWPEALAALHGLADTALAAGLALGWLWQRRGP
ncbi:MAG TPA: PEP-CTERM system histidine kinase PrsK, partial [Novosphingobium sp.]|nr:PEP-CTERM system histidine kinase PrsK [Novosphingobium sp.]